jgi:hypothetical protein
MVELKWTNLYTTLRVTLFCTWCHVFYRSFANVTLMFDHFQCHCTIIWQAFLRNLDCTVAGNIETMSLEMRIWPWIYDTLIYINEYTLNSRFVYVDVFSLHSNEMTSWQSSSAEKMSCNIVPFFYHHSVVIQHLVSDMRLSLISKENVHNIR